jgi:transcriptional regulator with XRE-family HTH domain
MVEKINQLCKQKNITIATLEKELGYGNGTIRKWDKSEPSIYKVMCVANYMHIPIDYLIGEEDLPSFEILELLNSIKKFDNAQLGLIKCYITLIESGKAG